MPPRVGETLGAYYYWAIDLHFAIEKCNVLQRAERKFYENLEESRE